MDTRLVGGAGAIIALVLLVLLWGTFALKFAGLLVVYTIASMVVMAVGALIKDGADPLERLFATIRNNNNWWVAWLIWSFVTGVVAFSKPGPSLFPNLIMKIWGVQKAANIVWWLLWGKEYAHSAAPDTTSWFWWEATAAMLFLLPFITVYVFHDEAADAFGAAWKKLTEKRAALTVPGSADTSGKGAKGHAPTEPRAPSMRGFLFWEFLLDVIAKLSHRILARVFAGSTRA